MSKRPSSAKPQPKANVQPARSKPVSAKRASPQPAAARQLDVPDEADDAAANQPLAAASQAPSGNESPTDSELPAEPPAESPAVSTRPHCPWHHLPTTAYATKGPFTYHKCPTAGCDFRTKVLRRPGVPRGM